MTLRLFVEGVDRDGGRASGIYEWAAVYEPLKSTGSPDFPALWRRLGVWAWRPVEVASSTSPMLASAWPLATTR
jgi:hypothetical protein